MTAPANITPAAVERYGPTLDALCPGFDGVQRRQRCGILYLRDRATAGLRVAGWEASMVLRTIESLACVHVFATMPAGELEELHHALVRLLVVAKIGRASGRERVCQEVEISGVAGSLKKKNK